MITLFHAPQSRSSRMIWLMEELEIPYQIQPVSIFRPRSGEGTPDPANPHPTKLVPAIDDDGVLVAESIAIVLYLDETHPNARLGVAAGDPRRGDYLTWLTWYAAEMEPAMMMALLGELPAAPMKQRRMDAVVQRIEAMLSRGSYAFGDRFSSVDLVIASALDFGRSAFPASETIDAYVARCTSRPAAVRARELDTAVGVQRSS